MKKNPLVSVAMPVYNAEKYIKQAIDSVLAQTYENFELVIVNDASSDRSKELVLSYSDSRIRYMENEVNLGIAKTRNKCVQQAAGKYIAVLDNDDIALPWRLEKQVEFLEADNDFALCGGFYDIIDGEGRLIHKMKLPVTDREVKTYLLFDNCFCNSSVMIKSRLLKENFYSEGFDMIEDYYFLYSVSKIEKLAILPLAITEYRVHGKNTSIEKSGGMRDVRKKMDNMILNDLGIQFTEEEFIIHTNFVTTNFGFFTNQNRVNLLENWLLKLYQFLDSCGQYEMVVVEKIFIRRWILLFKYTNQVSHKLIFNKLFRKFNFRYIGYFLELLTEKYSKQRTVA
jgi:glycosyltransferase involved in cell wall biosynthesis